MFKKFKFKNNTVKKLYAIYCFDNFDYQFDAELVFIFTSKKKALHAIKNNTYDFQSCTYKFCKLSALVPNCYVPFTNELIDVDSLEHREPSSSIYYKFVLKNQEDMEKNCLSFFTGDWVRMTFEEVCEQKRCDKGLADYIFAAQEHYRKDREAGQLKSYSELLKVMD